MTYTFVTRFHVFTHGTMHASTSGVYHFVKGKGWIAESNESACITIFGKRVIIHNRRPGPGETFLAFMRESPMWYDIVNSQGEVTFSSVVKYCEKFRTYTTYATSVEGYEFVYATSFPDGII